MTAIADEGLAPPERPRPPSLWRSLARRSWNGAHALEVMTADVRFDADGPVVLPGQAALVWELRPDLQQAFPLDRPASVYAYLAWVLGDGCLEGMLEPDLFTADFLDFLDGPPPRSVLNVPWTDGVPQTMGLWLTRALGHGRDRTPYWSAAVATPEGRVAHALWYAWIAPAIFGWPDGLGAATRRALQARSGVEVDGHVFSRGALALARSREDLRFAFDLDSESGRSTLIRWLVLHGLQELGVGVARFDPELADWLLAARSTGEGPPRWLELVREGRPDLMAAFPPHEAASAAGLGAWATFHFAEEHPDHPLTGVAGLATCPADEPIEVSLVLSGVWNSLSGRGEDVRSTAAALKTVGFDDFLVFDLASRRLFDRDGAALTGRPRVRAQVNLVHANADSALIDWRAARDCGIRVDRTVGWWAWELEELPSWWTAAFAFTDEVWAATTFAETAFRRSADRPVRLVPMAVIADREVPSAGPRARFGIAEGATLFFLAFDFRSYAARKNPEAAILAFRRAFPRGDENAVLLIKTQGAKRAPRAAAALAATAEGDTRIRLVDAALDRAELLALTQSADAFVSLHRSEGFGRGPAEAMALGRPVICTGYSGNRDFTRPLTALLVDYELVGVSPRDYPGVERQRWAEPDVNQAASHMRTVHAAPRSITGVAAAGQRLVRELYAPETAGRRVLEALTSGRLRPTASRSSEQPEFREDDRPVPGIEAVA